VQVYVFVAMPVGLYQ